MPDGPVQKSATLAINELVRSRIASGRRVLHLGFGEAGLPVAPELVERLAASARANDYRPSAGSAPLRVAVAGYLERRRLPTSPDLVAVAPGSKALLFAVLRAIPGDVLLPAPSWVSYAPHASLAGKRVGWVPIPTECGGIPDPERLQASITRMRREGGDPRVMVVTIPDNPTGTVATREATSAIADIARANGVAILSDEIYRDLAYEPARVLSPAEVYPEGTVVTTGLSKNLALGGWRIGFARFPESPWGRAAHASVVAIASELWSCLAAPMEDVAAWAMAEPEPVIARVAASRRLHRAVAEAVHSAVAESGAACRAPAAAFYLYPDFGFARERLAARGVMTGEDLAHWLLETHDVGVLHGSVFGDDPAALRFRASTSLLYGTTAEQREAALRSDDPPGLPWIAQSLERLLTVFSSVASV